MPKKNDVFIPFMDDLEKNNLSLINNNLNFNITKENKNNKNDDDDEADTDILKIKKYNVEAQDIAINSMMKQNIIPSHPFRCLASGGSGSGKTMLILNLLKRKNFFKNYFDVIFLFSPTAGKDQTQQMLNIPESNVESELDEKGVDHLKYIFDVQQKYIEKNGIGKSDKILIIFDDIISSEKFLNSATYKKVLIQGRHSNISSITLTQKFHAIPRTLRLQMTDIFFFPSSNSEIERLVDEFTPAGKSKKDFQKLVNIATSKQYNFLYINMKSPPEKRYRKNLDTYLII